MATVLYKGGYFETPIATILFDLANTYNSFALEFRYCSGLNVTDLDKNANKIEVIYLSGSWLVKITLNGTTTSYNDLQDYFTTGDLNGYFLIYYENTLLTKGDMSSEFDDYLKNSNVIFTFKINDERNRARKNLIYIDKLVGEFRSGINVINPVINIQNFNLVNTFNYVYLSALNRFYFVNNIEATTKNMSALVLHEDVLMSHYEIIKNQSAFIERQENNTTANITDELYILDINPVVTYSEITFTEYSPYITSSSGSYPYGDYVLTVISCLP